MDGLEVTPTKIRLFGSAVGKFGIMTKTFFFSRIFSYDHRRVLTNTFLVLIFLPLFASAAFLLQHQRQQLYFTTDLLSTPCASFTPVDRTMISLPENNWVISSGLYLQRNCSLTKQVLPLSCPAFFFPNDVGM